MDGPEMLRIETSFDRIDIQLRHGHHGQPTFSRNKFIVIDDAQKVAKYIGIRITIGVILHVEVWFDSHNLYSEMI